MALKTNQLIELGDKISQHWLERMNELANVRKMTNESEKEFLQDEDQAVEDALTTENS